MQSKVICVAYHKIFFNWDTFLIKIALSKINAVMGVCTLCFDPEFFAGCLCCRANKPLSANIPFAVAVDESLGKISWWCFHISSAFDSNLRAILSSGRRFVNIIEIPGELVGKRCKKECEKHNDHCRQTAFQSVLFIIVAFTSLVQNIVDAE